MHVVVAGATGATGSLVVARALEAGHRVTALVRDAAAGRMPAEVEVREVQVVSDAHLALPDDTDAVLSVLGPRTMKNPDPVCAPGTRNLLAAMERLGGRRRLVVVSATPVHTTGDGEPWWFRRLVRPLVRRAGRTMYADIAAMEDDDLPGRSAPGQSCGRDISRTRSRRTTSSSRSAMRPPARPAPISPTPSWRSPRTRAPWGARSG